MSSLPVEISIEKMLLGGDALGRASASTETDGKRRVLFVPQGAPGDRLKIHRHESKPNFIRAWPEAVLAPSSDRVEPACPYFYRPGMDPSAACGGCDWQHLSYDAQARYKNDIVREAFVRTGKIAKPPMEPNVTVDLPEGAWRYRNKVQIPFGLDPGGRPVAGFYAPGTHRIVPFDDCLIQDKVSIRILQAVRRWVEEEKASIYNSLTDEGWLRHLVIRHGSTGDRLVALVTRTPAFPGQGRFMRMIKEAVGHAALVARQGPSLWGWDRHGAGLADGASGASVYQNINVRPGNVVLGPKWIRLAGRPHLNETMLGLRFQLSPGAFFQVNHAMAEKLYRLVIEMAAPKPEDHVLELYAGIGVLGQKLAQQVKYVWGVEENHEAVRDAVESAHLNGLVNVRFMQGRCEQVLSRGQLQEAIAGKLATAIVDPPRAGCDEKVLRSLLRLKPARLIYVSCDPATLARDAQRLGHGGYHVKRIIPVDLFPQTSHIETVSLFEPVK